jgi:hypothetical protein
VNKKALASQGFFMGRLVQTLSIHYRSAFGDVANIGKITGSGNLTKRHQIVEIHKRVSGSSATQPQAAQRPIAGPCCCGC